MPRSAERAMRVGNRPRCHQGNCGTYVSLPCGKIRVCGGLSRSLGGAIPERPARAPLFGKKAAGARPAANSGEAVIAVPGQLL